MGLQWTWNFVRIAYRLSRKQKDTHTGKTVSMREENATQNYSDGTASDARRYSG